MTIQPTTTRRRPRPEGDTTLAHVVELLAYNAAQADDHGEQDLATDLCDVRQRLLSIMLCGGTISMAEYLELAER